MLCMNYGRVGVEGMFCTYCHSPLLGANPKQEFSDGVYLGEVEDENSPFLSPINPYFGYHFTFYGVTGTSKARAAMNLAVKAKNADLCLRILNPFRDNLVLRRIFYVYRSSIDPASIKGVNLLVNLHDLNRRVAYKREEMLIYKVITTAYLRKALNKSPMNRIENMFIADEAQLLVPKIVHKAIVTNTWVTTDFATRLRKREESLAIIT